MKATAYVTEYQPVLSAWALSPWRRVFDVVIASFGILIALPILIAAGLAVRFSSPGPILFRQVRVGRNGSRFDVLKFRSMRVQQSPAAPLVTRGDDVRITRPGLFLRNYKIDELPQLWNVLRGDMSMIGPRPFVPDQDPVVFRVRPGITGLGSIAFRDQEQLLRLACRDEIQRIHDEVFLPARQRLDAEYLSSCSLTSDLKIMWATALAVTLRRKSSTTGLDVRTLVQSTGGQRRLVTRDQGYSTEVRV